MAKKTISKKSRISSDNGAKQEPGTDDQMRDLHRQVMELAGRNTVSSKEHHDESQRCIGASQAYQAVACSLNSILGPLQDDPTN